MRRSQPLRRTTPLARTALARSGGLGRGAGLARTAMVRRETRSGGVPTAVRDLVRARALGRCERCGASAGQVGAQQHHRRPRAMGGSRAPDTNTAANLLALCPGCHRDVEDYRALAIEHGLLVASGGSPAAKPVLLAVGWVWLDDEGGIAPADPPTSTPSYF